MIKKLKSQRGIYISIIAVFSVAVIALALLMIGVGYLTTNDEYLQNTANNAAMAAIKTWAEKAEEGTYKRRADAAKSEATKIIHANKITGVVGGAQQGRVYFHDETGPDSVGNLYFGQWFDEPDPGVCPDDLPCFVPNLPPSQVDETNPPIVSAVKFIRHTENKKIVVPFANFFGLGSTTLKNTAIATSLARCMAFVFDVSTSTTSMSHSNSSFYTTADGPGGNPYKYIDFPTNAAYFVYARRWIKEGAFDGNCSDPRNYSYTLPSGLKVPNIDFYYYCSADPALHVPAGTHEKQHYVAMPSQQGMVDVDLAVVAQPLETYLTAANAALHEVGRQQTGNDRAMLLAFTRNHNSRLPAVGLSTNLAFFTQLTHYPNIGKINPDPPYDLQETPIHPNFIDHNFFSIPGITYGTNIQLALDTAYDSLMDPDSCPANAKRVIVLATDGAFTHTFPGWTGVSGSNPCPNNAACPKIDFGGGPPPSLWHTWLNYALGQMLDTSSGSFLKRFIDNKISISILAGGAHIGPNRKRIKDSNGKWIIDDNVAYSLGYGGYVKAFDDPPDKLMMNFSATVPDPLPPGVHPNCQIGGWYDHDCALIHLGADGFVFRPAAAFLMDLARLTGGQTCFLQNTAPAGCYTGPGGSLNLDDPLCYNEPGEDPEYYTRSLYNRTLGEQAADCTRRAVGSLPYRLRIDGLK